MHFFEITVAYWLLSFFKFDGLPVHAFPPILLTALRSSLYLVLTAETVFSSKDYVHIKMVYTCTGVQSKNMSETFYFFRNQRIFKAFAALIILFESYLLINVTEK